jgi:hypothetical protein
MSSFLNHRDQHLITMKLLSALGLEKRVIKGIGGVIPRETNLYHNAMGALPLRKGEIWLQNRYNGILVDRLIRVYESILGDITSDKALSPEDLCEVITSYLALYPYDNMNATRIFYLIKNIKSGAQNKGGVVNVESEGCNTCGQKYYIHPKLTRNCSACELEKEAKKDPSIYEEIRRTIYVEGTNLSNVRPKALKLSDGVVKILKQSIERDKALSQSEESKIA